MNLWTSRASTSPEIDKLDVKPLTPMEIAWLRESERRRAAESPFRCECLRCKLEELLDFELERDQR